MKEYYKIDLANIHDEGFANHAIKSFPKTLEIIGKHHKSGFVVDLGCGSGITAAKLIKNGYQVYGVDYSKSMIALARKRAPNAKFKVGSIYEFEIPQCKAVLAIGECLNYSFDNRGGYNLLRTLFKKIYKSLEKNGILIFDILEEDQMENERPVRTFVESKYWTVLTEKREHKASKVLRRRIITFFKTKSYYKKSEELHIMKLYKSETIMMILENIGFKVKRFRSYGSYKLRNNHAVIVARK